jgi:hypothetical protein
MSALKENQTANNPSPKEMDMNKFVGSSSGSYPPADGSGFPPTLLRAATRLSQKFLLVSLKTFFGIFTTSFHLSLECGHSKCFSADKK